MIVFFHLNIMIINLYFHMIIIICKKTIFPWKKKNISKKCVRWFSHALLAHRGFMTVLVCCHGLVGHGTPATVTPARESYYILHTNMNFNHQIYYNWINENTVLHISWIVYTAPLLEYNCNYIPTLWQS